MMNVKRTSPRLSRTESRALTRAALLAAGAEVFAERGYHRAAVEDIAERAGFTRGAFYANFRDKADLLLTLLDEQSAHNLDALDQLVERDVEGYGLGALATWFVQTFAVASPLDVAVAEFTPLALRDPEHAARIRQRMRAVRDRVTGIVDAECARADFAIPIPSERFATMIIGLVDGMGSLHRLDPEVAPADLLTEALLFLGEGLATHVQPTR
jgi:AcrR family transcriptional regulator